MGAVCVAALIAGSSDSREQAGNDGQGRGAGIGVAGRVSCCSGAGAWGAPLGVVAADETPIAAENVATLRKQVGESVTVVGRIARTGRSASGMQFLNFADSELTLVCGKQDAAKFKPKDPADQFRGQVVTVRGELELYRGKVQIRLRATGADRDQGKTGREVRGQSSENRERRCGGEFTGSRLSPCARLARTVGSVPPVSGTRVEIRRGRRASSILLGTWKISPHAMARMGCSRAKWMTCLP